MLEDNLARELGAPALEDFGIAREQYAIYEGTSDAGSGWGLLFMLVWSLSVAIPIGFFFAALWFFLTLVLSAIPFGFVGMSIVRPAVARYKRDRLLNSPVASHIRTYEEAYKAWVNHILFDMEEAAQAEWKAGQAQREADRKEREAEWARWEAESARRQKEIDYWMSLSGRAFEREMAALCRRLGYRVETTPASGDEGVDLVLWRRKQKIVVQCKGHKSPVGPAVARELYGSMIAAKAHKAVLACTGGFTKGVKEFAKGKPIELVEASGLVELADGLSGSDTHRQELPWWWD